MVPMPTSDARPAHNLLGFWRFDPETRIAHADEGVCAAFGVPAADGQAGADLGVFEAKMHPDDREPFAAGLREAYENGTTFAQSYRIIDGHPSPFPVFALGRAFRGPDHGARHYVGALFEAGRTRSAENARVEMINHLIASLDAARELDEPIMARLIEAVLLEAGRRLADGSGQMADGIA